MASEGYTGRVLVAAARGGYKYVPVGSVDKRLWKSVRRVIKVGRGKARRRRFWVKKETEVVRYTRTFALKDDMGRGGTPEALVDVIVQDEEPVDMTDKARMKKLKSGKMTSRMMRIIEGDQTYMDKYSHLVPDNYYIADNAWGGVEVRGSGIDEWAADYRGPS